MLGAYRIPSISRTLLSKTETAGRHVEKSYVKFWIAFLHIDDDKCNTVLINKKRSNVQGTLYVCVRLIINMLAIAPM